MPLLSLNNNTSNENGYWLQWIGMGCAATLIAVLFFWTRTSELLACTLLVAAIACYARGTMLSNKSVHKAQA